MEKIWIDATEFTDRGGFILDTQFVREMGQSYLLANGVGEAVSPASTQFSVKEGGKYRVHIRTKNWCNECSPDGLIVSIDGIASEHICANMHSLGWYFEIAGDFELSKGTHTISVADTKGWFARFACVIITNDFDFTPSRDTAKLLDVRKQIKGENSCVTDGGKYDLIVVGGGVAGIVTAVSAARLGVKVALINDRPILGGNGSDEAHIALEGAAHRGEHETGIIYEIKSAMLKDNLTWTECFERFINKEKNITLFNNMLADGADCENGKIISIYATDVITLKKYTFSADLYTDATGDAWLGYYADALYHIGREASSQYNESFAPEIADGNTMSGCITKKVTDGKDTICSFYSVLTDIEQKFTPPDFAYKLPEGDELGREPMYIDRGEWWLETPNDYDDLFESEYVRDTMFRIAVGYFDWLKNSWKDRERVKNYKLKALGTYNAKRESRRLIGDYVMTGNDYKSGTDFPDSVCYCGWNIDVHHVGGIFSGKSGAFNLNEKIPITPLPFRCLYSKNVDNLMMVGRCISVSHVGLGPARTQLTGATMGQAVGTAAYICKKYGCTPRETDNKYIKELQQLLLLCDQYIPYVYNNDENDIARKAKITATSETESGKAVNVINGKTRPLDGEDYAFVSKGELPQSLFLEFKEETQIHQIRITFDIPFKDYSYGYLPQPTSKYIASDFEIKLKAKDGKEKTVSVKDNFNRLVVLDIDKVVAKSLEIKINKCIDFKYAKIVEVRIY